MDPLAQAGLQTRFGLVDWLLVFVFLGGVTAIGVWSRRFVVSMTDYVVAGCQVKAYLGVASIIATEMGLVTVMYAAEQGFTNGFAAFHIAACAALVAVLVGVTGFIVGPLRASGAMTIPEYYEQRFGREVRAVGGTVLALSGILNMGLFLKADSLFVTSVVGLGNPLHLKVAMTIMLALVLLYTMLGGMVAVLITDYLQFVVMAFALLATSVFLMTKFGWSDLVQGVEALKGAAGFDPLSNPNYGPLYVVWMLFLGLVSCALWQTAAIRASSAEDQQVVRKTYTWGALGFLIRFMIPYFWGICALVFIASRPELEAIFMPAGGASSDVTLRAMPAALTSLLPSGAIGLLTAGMLAAAMSIYNSYLHVWSAVLTQDVIAPLGEILQARGMKGCVVSDHARIRLTQGIMAIIGIFLLVWGLWYPLGQDLWGYMAVTGGIYFTGAFAVLVGGLYWPRASRTGAFLAFGCGLLMLGGLKPVQKALKVSWPGAAVGLTTVAIAALVMVLGSLAWLERKVAA